MASIICGICKEVHHSEESHCPVCGPATRPVYDFRNSDEYLKAEVPRVLKERKETGLEGLVGGLDHIIITTEADRLESAAIELADRTGHRPAGGFEDQEQAAFLLEHPGSAGIIVRSRKGGENPFLRFNRYPRFKHLPNTRLETLVFTVRDIDAYVDIQSKSGRSFLTREVQEFPEYRYIETVPSEFTGNSIGLIHWKGKRGDFRSPGRTGLTWRSAVHGPKGTSIGILDHMATRVRAEERDRAIIEFMELTSYTFDFAVYVKVFNSITNVARLAAEEFAMVFTSGIQPFINERVSGPTEKFIRNYGPRVHHMAFRTEDVERTFEALHADGQEFLIEVVGSSEEGIQQTFTDPSDKTLIVNEYIHRFRGFTGFFTPDNVTRLTGSTNRQ